MVKPRILVTGASGKTGRVVVTEMLNAGLRELARFLITPLRRGFDLDRYDRELRRPFPSAPQSAPESAIWRREHAVTRIERRPPPAPAHGMLATRSNALNHRTLT